MAQESKPSRPRTASTGQDDLTEPAMAPITSNTPLPPLNPLPLPSQEAASDPAYPSPGLMPPDVQTPPPYQPFGSQMGKPGGFGSASRQGVPPTWAIGTIFIMMFTSLILLVVLAVSAANVDRHTNAIWWAMAILIVANVLFTLIVVNLSRGLGPLSLPPFLRLRRGP